MSFTPIPDESNPAESAGFTRRHIRKAAETDLIARTERLLTKYEMDGGDMLVSDLKDLELCLHRMSLLVQKTKHAELTRRLRKHTNPEN